MGIVKINTNHEYILFCDQEVVFLTMSKNQHKPWVSTQIFLDFIMMLIHVCIHSLCTWHAGWKHYLRLKKPCQSSLFFNFALGEVYIFELGVKHHG